MFHLLDASTTSDFIASLNNHSLSHSYQRSQQQLKQSQYYEMNLLNCKTVKIRFDRLSLQAFLDRNLTTCELIFSIILAISVSVFSSILLYKSFFHDLTLVLFCLVVASSQYTLLKVFPVGSFGRQANIPLCNFRAFNLMRLHQPMALIVSPFTVGQYTFVWVASFSCYPMNISTTFRPVISALKFTA